MSISKDVQADGTASQAANANSGGGGALPVIALLAGLTGVGGTGLLYTQMQALQQSTNQELQSSSSAIESAVSELESANQATQSELNGSFTSLQSTLNTKVDDLAQSVNDQLSATTRQVDESLGAIDSTLSGKLDTAVSGMNTQLETTVTDFKAQIQATQMMINQNQRDWMMAEIEYLLRMAKHRVVLAADIEASVLALKSADEQLAAINEIELLPVRQQISEEIVELRTQEQPDIEGLIFTLSRLAKSAESLPVPEVQAPPAAGAGAAAPSNPLESFSLTGLLNKFEVTEQGSLNDSIIGSPSEQQLASSEVVRLHLQASQLAAVRRDQTAFYNHISSAIEETNARYETAHPRVKAFLSDLTEIQEAPINPVADKLGQSLQLLNEINTKLGAE